MIVTSIFLPACQNLTYKRHLPGVNMITLTRKLKKDVGHGSSSATESGKRVSIRDKLLVKEVQEMEQTLPSTCKVKFEDPHQLHDFQLTVTPDEGYWVGGRFRFHIYVTEDYNMAPPSVKCLTKLWHPNISEHGDICLSLLRQNSIDGMGWAPTRKLKDVIWGLNSLFTDVFYGAKRSLECYYCSECLNPTEYTGDMSDNSFNEDLDTIQQFTKYHMKFLPGYFSTMVRGEDIVQLATGNDLLNFDDPLNIEAAELYLKDKEAFQNRVREYVTQYAKR